MSPVLPGIVRVILRGRLAQEQSFAVLLAERMPPSTDPIAGLLEAAESGAPPVEPMDLEALECLGLQEEPLEIREVR